MEKELSLDDAKFIEKIYNATDANRQYVDYRNDMILNKYKNTDIDYTIPEVLAYVLTKYNQKKYDKEFHKELESVNIKITSDKDNKKQKNIALQYLNYDFTDISSMFDTRLISKDIFKTCIDVILNAYITKDCYICTGRTIPVSFEGTNFSVSKELRSWLLVNGRVFDIFYMIAMDEADYKQLYNVEELSRISAVKIQEDAKNGTLKEVEKLNNYKPYLLARSQYIASLKQLTD